MFGYLLAAADTLLPLVAAYFCRSFFVVKSLRRLFLSQGVIKPMSSYRMMVMMAMTNVMFVWKYYHIGRSYFFVLCVFRGHPKWWGGLGRVS